MSQQALSPLLQVMHTPSFVGSHVQMPQVRLHWQTQMPLSMHEQLHIPSHSALHRFCNVAHETSSSHEHLIFMPPWHFSIFIVHRGTTHQPLAGGAAAGEPYPWAANPGAPA
jgi:hypothetical protein